jgi:hypothetical protein
MTMNIGMLWFDNDPKAAINAKIERAAAYYQGKYGRQPDLCFVHPSMLPAEAAEAQAAPLKTGPVEVRASQTVLPNHFWIGVNGVVQPSES